MTPRRSLNLEQTVAGKHWVIWNAMQPQINDHQITQWMMKWSKVFTERAPPGPVKSHKLKYFGHISRHACIEKDNSWSNTTSKEKTRTLAFFNVTCVCSPDTTYIWCLTQKSVILSPSPFLSPMPNAPTTDLYSVRSILHGYLGRQESSSYLDPWRLCIFKIIGWK